jgi:hypothetical protein
MSRKDWINFIIGPNCLASRLGEIIRLMRSAHSSKSKQNKKRIRHYLKTTKEK